MSVTTELQVLQGDLFLSLVDFKWLMAGLGWQINLSRMRNDRAYAARCVNLGLASDSVWLL